MRCLAWFVFESFIGATGSVTLTQAASVQAEFITRSRTGDEPTSALELLLIIFYALAFG